MTHRIYLKHADIDSSIPQLGSVGKLGISYVGFKALLAATGNFPPVLEMVRAFGTKINYDANPIPPFQKHFDHPRSVYRM